MGQILSIFMGLVGVAILSYIQIWRKS